MVKQKLIDAIDAVIKELEAGTLSHNWREYHACNIGLIARVITGKSGKDITDELTVIKKDYSEAGLGSDNNHWSDYVEYFCPISGLSKVELFRTLQEVGMSREDMMHLEYLSDPKVLAKTKRVVTKQQYHFFGLFKGVAEKNEFDMTKDDEGGEIEDYYEETDNFLLYLKKWKEILLEEGNTQV